MLKWLSYRNPLQYSISYHRNQTPTQIEIDTHLRLATISTVNSDDKAKSTVDIKIFIPSTNIQPTPLYYSY